MKEGRKENRSLLYLMSLDQPTKRTGVEILSAFICKSRNDLNIGLRYTVNNVKVM